MPVTIKQIAAHSGLSLQTVSRILNNREGQYRPETRRRVLEAAQHLGYLPNSSARAMRTGSFGAVALLLGSDPISSLLPALLLDGIFEGLEEQGLHLTVTRLPDQNLTDEGFVPKILREWGVDGLLVNYNTDIPPQMVALIDQHAVPAVWINSKQDHDCVYPDDVAGGRQAAEHLLDLGHRRITYLNFFQGAHYSSVDRCRGYREAMRAAGLPAPPAHTISAPAGFPDLDSLTEWLRRGDRPTAVIAYTPDVTAPLLYAAAAAGLSVPHDLSVITFNDSNRAGVGRPVDAVLLPEHRMGAVAVEMLTDKIEDRTRCLPPCALPFTLAAGFTSAPPRSPSL